jgi:hypothetical protein
MFGLTTEAYLLATRLVDRATVAIVDETLQMALDLDSKFLMRNPDLSELMNGEPLMSFKPIENVLASSSVVFFTPKLRRPSEESLIEASAKLRELSRYLANGATLVNTLPTGPGGNAENIMVVEKQTGCKIGESMNYAYIPLRPGTADARVVSFTASHRDENPLEALGFKANVQNIFGAELSYVSSVLTSAVKMATEIELMKKARDAKVLSPAAENENYFDDFALDIHELKAIQSSEEAGESITYLAGAALKSFDNYVRYVVDETREMLKELELKASRTKVIILWSLDRYEMRGDRLQMAENISQRLRDYVTDVEVVSGRRLASGSEVFDSQKHNLAIVCSKSDHDSLKASKKSHRSVGLSIIHATPTMQRE